MGFSGELGGWAGGRLTGALGFGEEARRDRGWRRAMRASGWNLKKPWLAVGVYSAEGVRLSFRRVALSTSSFHRAARKHVVTSSSSTHRLPVTSKIVMNCSKISVHQFATSSTESLQNPPSPNSVCTEPFSPVRTRIKTEELGSQ